MAVAGEGAAGAGAGNNQKQDAGGGGAAPAWTDGLAPELTQLVTTKGWKNPGEALASYAGLEKLVGSDKIAVPGKDADEAAWNGVYDALGRPKDSKGYEFKAPDDAATIAYDPKLADWFRGAAHQAGLNPRQAAQFHDRFVEMRREEVKAAVAQIETDRAAAMKALETKWGPQFAARKERALMAMKALGSPELAAYYNATGAGDNPVVIEHYDALYERIGEDALKGSGAGLGLTMSQQEAEAEIKKIRGAATTDPKHPLMDRLHPEHQALVERIDRLSKIAYPEPKAA